MNTKSSANASSHQQSDAALIGKQQLLIKSRLQQNALTARQQLKIKTKLASDRKDTEPAK